MSTPIKKPIPTRHYFDSITQDIVPYPLAKKTQEDLKVETTTKEFFEKELKKWREVAKQL